ncbi:alpha/beta-hydrolase [Hypoxylon sp. NC0597]|nr:alpha/beta-hydrolase [Hypoxylon sp. NC0597]
MKFIRKYLRSRRRAALNVPSTSDTSSAPNIPTAIEKFTPEAFVFEPRRSYALPNHDGTLAIYTIRSNEIDGCQSVDLHVIDIATGDSRLLARQVSEVTWLGDGSNTVLFTEVSLLDTTIRTIDAGMSPSERQEVGYMSSRLEHLRIKPLQDGSIALAVIALTNADGSLRDTTAETTSGGGLVYDNYRVQEFNKFVSSERYSIFYSSLTKVKGHWELTGPLHNALPTANLEPIGAYVSYDPSDNYDISQRGITLAACDPKNTASTAVYYVPIDSFAKASVHGPVKVGAGSEGIHEDSRNARFSPDGSAIASLRNTYAAPDKYQIYIHRLGSSKAINVYDMVIGKEWSLIPTSFEFAPNGHSLYMTAEHRGRTGLYKVDLQPNGSPKTLLCDGSVESFYPLSENDTERLLVTSSSLVESSLYQIVDANGDREPTVVSSATNHGARFNLSPSQVSEISFQGGGDYHVRAWMVRPRSFDESRKHPLVILVHGGPKYSWNDKWVNSMFHLPLWAEQGYVVVAPNITGSIGYGVEFTRAIQDNWGGRPYEDLVKCMEYLENVPYIDTDNAVIAGASYGGYMVNWIQGHPLGRRFKAMVCCCGVFDIPTNLLQSDMINDSGDTFGGSPRLWESQEGVERYNPARPDLLPNWTTPMLVVHGAMDYRCPIANGLATFHALQLLGTPSKFLVFPFEGHGIGNDGNLLQYYHEVFAWINKYTGIANRTKVVDDPKPESSDIKNSGIENCVISR